MQKIPYIIQMPYNLAQKWDNSVQICTDYWSRMTHDGGKVVPGELSLAELLQGMQGNPLARVTLALR